MMKFALVYEKPGIHQLAEARKKPRQAKLTYVDQNPRAGKLAETNK